MRHQPDRKVMRDYNLFIVGMLASALIAAFIQIKLVSIAAALVLGVYGVSAFWEHRHTKTPERIYAFVMGVTGSIFLLISVAGTVYVFA